MNKYQEALDGLVYVKENFVYHEGRMIQIKNIKNTKLLQELVDKTTPFKPLNQEIEGVNGVLYGQCKCCCEVWETYKFCPHCGQALKWSNDGPTK